MPVPDDIALRQYLYSYIDWTNTRSVLDIGCGSGFDLREMGQITPPDVRLVGVDSMEKSIAAARSQKDSRFAFVGRKKP